MDHVGFQKLVSIESEEKECLQADNLGVAKKIAKTSYFPENDFNAFGEINAQFPDIDSIFQQTMDKRLP